MYLRDGLVGGETKKDNRFLTEQVKADYLVLYDLCLVAGV